MGRTLDTKTLDAASQHYAGQFLLPGSGIGGRDWVLKSLKNLTFRDERQYLLNKMRGHLGPIALKELDDSISKTIKEHTDDQFHKALADHLALDPNGESIPGKLGKVKQGQVTLGWRVNKRGMPRIVRGDILAGETEDQAIFRLIKLHQDHGQVILPISQLPPTMMALNTRISNEAALGACDFVVDRLDEGSGAAIIQGRSGAQPADPDTAASGTLLFTLVCTDPAFGNAADANPGGRATASAITSDSSADATGTLGYCRGSASNDGATSLDDHIDGEAGTSGADFNFNTLAIVSGANVSLSSWTVTMPES